MAGLFQILDAALLSPADEQFQEWRNGSVSKEVAERRRPDLLQRIGRVIVPVTCATQRDAV